MAKRTKPKQKATTRQRRARRDVLFAQRPQLNAINREQEQAQAEYEQARAAAQGAYGGYQDLLAGMPDYGQQVAGIKTDLQSQLSALAGMLGGSEMLPGPESTAGSNLGTVLGAGALEALASNQARQGAYQASAQREGGIAQRESLGNLLQTWNDMLTGFQNRRLDVTEQTPQAIMQRIDELRQQSLENQVVKRKMQSDEAFAQFLQRQLGVLTNPPRNPNPTTRTNPNPTTRTRPPKGPTGPRPIGSRGGKT